MIHALVSIVEDLNLNTRIWSKNKTNQQKQNPFYMSNLIEV